jgi:hypothetical protein
VGHKYSLEKVEAFKLEGVIIENIIKEGVTLEVSDVVKIKEINLRLCENKNYALLVDAKAGSTINDEARSMLASAELAHFNMAKAVILYTQKQKILGNIYLRVNKPHVNTRLFTNRAKALKWLKLQISNFEVKELLS